MSDKLHCVRPYTLTPATKLMGSSNENGLSVEQNQSDERTMLRNGGQTALATLLSEHRDLLLRIITFRIEPALRSRVDPEDILQEAYIEIARRIDEYVAGVPVSFFVWIRQRTIQTLIDIHRSHFREKRDAMRDVPLVSPNYGQTTSLSMARHLADNMTSPSQAAVKSEQSNQLHQALEAMNETDREILAMRHFEHLSNLQVAEVLGITPTAASNRYVRAAAKLSEILRSISPR